MSSRTGHPASVGTVVLWSSPAADGDDAAAQDEAESCWPWKAQSQMGEWRMGDVRYAVRVRGHSRHAVTVAGQRGLDVAIDPERTLLRGPLLDQAALFGILAMARRLGLEVIEVRRLPQGRGR
jgi:hypothetical protein